MPTPKQYADGLVNFGQTGLKAQEIASKFNPNGSDYDYDRAISAGMRADGTGENANHWGSVAPASEDEMSTHGLPEGSYIMLKGYSHPTWNKAVEAENARGSNIQKKGDRFFSIPMPK